MWRLVLLFAIITMAAAGSMQNTAMAVEYGGVGGRPEHPRADNSRSSSIFIHTMKPGSQSSDAVKIYNNTAKTRTINVTAVDAVLASGGAFSCAQQSETAKGVGGWVALDTDKITLKAGGSKVVPFTITAPDVAEVGEHNGCIAIQDVTATKKQTKNSGITLGFRSAIRLVVTVPGKIIKDITLEKISVTAAKNNKYTISPTAVNHGNVSIDTNVDVSLNTVFGSTVKTNKGVYPVLPKSTAQWNFEVDKPFWGGVYVANATISYNNEPQSLLGEKKGPNTSKSLRSGIVVIPPTATGAFVEILALVIVIVLFVTARRRMYRRRQIARVWTSYTVRNGETISEIASRYHVSWKQLAAANKIKPPYALKNQQKIKVPTKSNRRA